MRLTDLTGKKVCILGFGREGQATLKEIEEYDIECDITIADAKPIELQISDYTTQTGPDYLKNLSQFDVIIKSPGIPPSPELTAHHSKLTSATQIFLDTVRETGCLVIGVTGSKGKSTTSTLIYEILRAARKDAYLVGNIGSPALEYLEHARKETIFVLEMSSYQLMDLTVSPQIAVITSFFPEHLDYHGSLEAYKEAKKHITRFQGKNDVVFFCEDFSATKEIASASKGKKIPFSADGSLVTLDTIYLLGRHNLSNISAACAVAMHLGVDRRLCIQVCREFRGLPHRLQALGLHKNIDWVDDAISTTPESTIAALDALGSKVSTIILGGQDRGNDFKALGKRLARSGVRTAILFPGSGPRIREAIEDSKANVKMFDADTMEKAVELAKTHTAPNTICLLSTASPSYGMFKNFEDKGERFKRAIMQ